MINLKHVVWESKKIGWGEIETLKKSDPQKEMQKECFMGVASG